jgi:hypothetical protein
MAAVALREVAPPRLRVISEPAPQAALLAQLTQALTKALMQGVHEAASLNVATVHALLAPTDGSLGGELQRVVESWRFSWRTFQICAATAADVLRLSEAHGRASVDAVWQLLDGEWNEDAPLRSEQAASLRNAFDALRDAQLRYFDAAIEAHRRLIGVAVQARLGDA